MAEKRPKLLILGYGRHGKDTVAEILRDQYGLRFKSSSEFVGEECLWDQWGKAVYPTFEAMFEDRHNHRELWMQMISAYNTPDKTRTASTMFERGFDMYVGMRRQNELDACKAAGVFDKIIWVQRPGFPVETGSMDITPESAGMDYMIMNDGDLRCLEERVAHLVHDLTTVEGFHWRLPKMIDMPLRKLAMEHVSNVEKLRAEAETEEMKYKDFDILTSPMVQPDIKPQAVEEVDLMATPDNAVQVLDHGYVALVDVMGTDDDIAEAARLSYGRGTKKARDNSGLIRYLYSHAHTSPFEMVEMKFQMRLPIFVMRQWVRHRTANLNEYSGRYSVMPRMWYTPEPEQIMGQDTVNKQGSSGGLQPIVQETVQRMIWEQANQCFNTYEEMLAMGVSREMARIVLPLNTYTEIMWKMDLNNMLKFLWLRDDSHAQPEIQAFAKVIAQMVEDNFPKTYAAYKESRESITLSKRELLAIITGDRSALSKSETVKSESLQRDLQEWIRAEMVK
ncbi:thymidylate synthase [Ruegeria phage vB_RpoP-V13]|uniref:Thymidylate synthase n=1 Tax=Ruegeria phage vB_RpoP-V13 TaxID=2218612 RepID=A0A2Z4QGH6_9CAUD|nr:thymidylate synthase [Ruegeria phage vB_RpoP-V13]AWY09380.1 thymidylate synthase [Ruegeria phage vB_RpoP-V13]